MVHRFLLASAALQVLLSVSTLSLNAASRAGAEETKEDYYERLWHSHPHKFAAALEATIKRSGKPLELKESRIDRTGSEPQDLDIADALEHPTIMNADEDLIVIMSAPFVLFRPQEFIFDSPYNPCRALIKKEIENLAKVGWRTTACDTTIPQKIVDSVAKKFSFVTGTSSWGHGNIWLFLKRVLARKIHVIVLHSEPTEDHDALCSKINFHYDIPPEQIFRIDPIKEKLRVEDTFKYFKNEIYPRLKKTFRHLWLIDYDLSIGDYTRCLLMDTMKLQTLNIINVPCPLHPVHELPWLRKKLCNLIALGVSRNNVWPANNDELLEELMHNSCWNRFRYKYLAALDE